MTSMMSENHSIRQTEERADWWPCAWDPVVFVRETFGCEGNIVKMSKAKRDQRRRASSILRKRQTTQMEVVTEEPKSEGKLSSLAEGSSTDVMPVGEAGACQSSPKEPRIAVVAKSESDSTGPPATGDPGEIYSELELSHKLGRLEEPAVLAAAMAVMLRQLEGGSRIAFPRMEHVDRLYVAQYGLPTDYAGLQFLIRKAFARRGFQFDPDRAFDDAVRTYGRRTFDYSKPFQGYRLVFA